MDNEAGHKRKEVGNYKDGKKYGKWTSYNEDGQITIEANYKDGKEDGKSTWYFDDGKILAEGNAKDGDRHGKWTYYDLDGSINEIIHYKHGVIDMFENGTYKKDGMKDGKKHGKWYTIDRRGKVIKTENYEDGKKIEPKMSINEEEKVSTDNENSGMRMHTLQELIHDIPILLMNLYKYSERFTGAWIIVKIPLYILLSFIMLCIVATAPIWIGIYMFVMFPMFLYSEWKEKNK